MKLTAAVTIFVLLFVLVAQQSALSQRKARKRTSRLLIAECAGDGTDAWIPYSGTREKIARAADVDLEAAFHGNTTATFWFLRNGKEISSASIDDIDSGSVWIAIDRDPSAENRARIAFTYSDGGAVGNFHVRVFLIDGAGVTDASKSIDTAVAAFKSRHYCDARGNNVTALKWINGNLLLLTEVYPTGDCDRDLGHTEGYLVSVPQGKILEHMTLNQLEHYPGVCLVNWGEN
jgi:hypothetical protein